MVLIYEDITGKMQKVGITIKGITRTEAFDLVKDGIPFTASHKVTDDLSKAAYVLRPAKYKLEF